MLEYPSSMTDTLSLNARIADRVRELRAARGLSLDALATRSGVSRSMISVIERGESSPTAVVLEKLSVGLGVRVRRALAAPAAGYPPRTASPSGVAHPFQIVEVEFPARARVAFETGARDVRVDQQVWVL